MEKPDWRVGQKFRKTTEPVVFSITSTDGTYYVGDVLHEKTGHTRKAVRLPKSYVGDFYKLVRDVA